MVLSNSTSKKQDFNAAILFGSKYKSILKALQAYNKHRLISTIEIDLILKFLSLCTEDQVTNFAKASTGRNLVTYVKRFLSAKHYSTALTNLNKIKVPKAVRVIALNNDQTPDAVQETSGPTDLETYILDSVDDTLATFISIDMQSTTTNRPKVNVVYPAKPNGATAKDINMSFERIGSVWQQVYPESRRGNVSDSLGQVIDAAVDYKRRTLTKNEPDIQEDRPANATDNLYKSISDSLRNTPVSLFSVTNNTRVDLVYPRLDRALRIQDVNLVFIYDLGEWHQKQPNNSDNHHPSLEAAINAYIYSKPKTGTTYVPSTPKPMPVTTREHRPNVVATMSPMSYCVDIELRGTSVRANGDIEDVLLASGESASSLARESKVTMVLNSEGNRNGPLYRITLAAHREDVILNLLTRLYIKGYDDYYLAAKAKSQFKATATYKYAMQIEQNASNRLVDAIPSDSRRIVLNNTSGLPLSA